MKRHITTIYILALFLLVFSCDLDKGQFTISNESDFDIEALSITPDADNRMISLKKGETIEHNINMKMVNTDGTYRLSFKNESTGQTITRAFGYYTNGNQIEDIIKVRILNDTIMTSGKFDFIPN
ncbi:MAG: hypothetical protein HRU49_13820 [Winogradskyella sp.]|uniref:hypothetical protein n=1 Tax=Winogradskyella sp. TaxID=1883156 RepID=UPI0025DBE109|nr:hypothetical protein [Winogradskyella sp.]NRB84828.1 hypothetical protein [Winogradskyella sp.]